MKVQICSLEDRRDVYKVFERIGVDPEAWEIMWKKSATLCLLIDDLSMAGGNVLKQTALSSGAEAAVSGGIINGTSPRTKVLLMGTRSQLSLVASKIKIQQFHLSELSDIMENILSKNEAHGSPVWKMRDKEIKLDRPRIIGIINVTPDSFYQGSRNYDPQSAVDLAMKMAEQGADMLDIGGESSRPGSSPLDLEEEAKRVLPVIRKVREKTFLPVSIDTVNPTTAETALGEGCDAINDILGFENPKMTDVAVKYNSGAVIMHKKGQPSEMQKDPRYDDVFEEVRDFLKKRVDIAESSGVRHENIVCDPGIGFGKTAAHNLALLRRLADMKAYLDKPVYIGLSRKSLVGALGGGQTPADRLYGSLSLSTLALTEGVMLFRTHDVLETKKALDTAFEALRNGRWV